MRATTYPALLAKWIPARRALAVAGAVCVMLVGVQVAGPTAHAASPGSPERLWEAFPLDPSNTGPGTSDEGITLQAPDPLPEAPPQAPEPPSSEELAPVAGTGAEDGGGSGIGTGVVLGVAAAALLAITLAVFVLRILRARPAVDDETSGQTAAMGPERESAYPRGAEAIDQSQAATTVVTETPRPAERPPSPPPPPATTERETPPAPTTPPSERTPPPSTPPEPTPPSAAPPQTAPTPLSTSPEPERGASPPAVTGPARRRRAGTPIDVVPEPLEPGSGVNQLYGAAVCLEFVSGLSDDVLERAIVLFGLLSRHGSVDSVTAAHALGVTPQELPGLIITPLRRRSDALDLPVAYLAERHETTGRRVWRDRDGVAGRLREAAMTIRTARSVTNGDSPHSGRPSSRSRSLG